MFCMNCGTKLPDNAKFCFSCGFQLPAVGHEAVDQPSVPTQKIELNPPYISKIYNDILCMASNVATSFVSCMDKQYSGLDEFMSRGISDISDVFLETEKYALGLLHEKGVYHYGLNDVRRFTRKYMGFCADTLSELSTAYENAIGKSQEALAYSDYLRDNHAHLVGGGFGVAGAIKGIALAGAVNATIGAFHSYAANARERTINADLSARKNSIYHNESFRAALAFAIETDIKESIHGICDLFTELNLGTLPFYPLDNLLQSANILDAVVEGHVPKQNMEQVAYQIIEMYPVHRDMYLYAADICPEKKDIFFSMAHKYGIDIAAYFAALDEKAQPIATKIVNNPIAQILIEENALSADIKKNFQFLSESIDENFSERFGMCGKGGKFKSYREQMRKYFAKYPDTEFPILYLDASKYGDGKEGIVLTNKKVYAGSYTQSKRWAIEYDHDCLQTIDYYMVGEDAYLRLVDADKEMPTYMSEDEVEIFVGLMEFFTAMTSYIKAITGIRVVSTVGNEGFVEKLKALANKGGPSQKKMDNISGNSNDTPGEQFVEYSATTLVNAFNDILTANKKKPSYYLNGPSTFQAAVYAFNKWLDRDLRIISKVYDDFDENEEVLVFYCDPTIGGTFKESFLMTDKYFHCHSNKHGSWKLRYKDITNISIEGEFWTYLAINGRRIPYTASDEKLKEMAYDLEHFFIPFFRRLEH